MALIAFGVLVCAYGELNLVVKGLILQLSALVFEVRSLHCIKTHTLRELELNAGVHTGIRCLLVIMWCMNDSDCVLCRPDSGFLLDWYDIVMA